LEVKFPGAKLFVKIFFKNNYNAFLDTNYVDIVLATLRILSLTSISCIGTQFCALCLIIRTIIKSLNEELRNWLLETLKNPDSVPKKLPGRLLDLRMVFAKIYDICGEMNNIFGIFILLTLTYHNTFIHVEMFQIFAQVVESTLVMSAWNFGHTKAAVWAAVNLMKILAFFVCCTLVTSEVRNILN